MPHGGGALEGLVGGLGPLAADLTGHDEVHADLPEQCEERGAYNPALIRDRSRVWEAHCLPV